jgi:SAM-dependent methyltransferase
LDRLAKVKVEYQVATAEKTGLPSSSVDIVTAGQCWHWFNRSDAAREVYRILRPDGQVVIAHFDWIPLNGNVVEATEELILEFNPTWNMGGGNGLYPLWLRDLGEAGFVEIESFTYDLDVPYEHEAWRGRIRASAGVGASLSQRTVFKFDKALERMLKERFPQPTLQIHHRIFTVIARKSSREEKYEFKS